VKRARERKSPGHLLKKVFYRLLRERERKTVLLGVWIRGGSPRKREGNLAAQEEEAQEEREKAN